MPAEAVGTMPTASTPDNVTEAAGHLAAGDAQAALDALRGAADANAGSLRLRFLAGLIAWRLGDVQQALTVLRACHDEAPMNGSIAEVLASLYAQAGNLAESLYLGKLSTALGPVAEFAELVPPSFPSFGAAFLAIRERPLFARAKMLVNGGQLLDGLDLARQHVSLNPSDTEARVFLGEGLLRAGGAAAATGVLAPVATGAMASPAVLSLYARALASVGEGTHAGAFHQQACSAASDDADIAAARLADATWIEDASAQLHSWIADWVERFSPPRKRARAEASKKLVIGYALSTLADIRGRPVIDRGRVYAVSHAGRMVAIDLRTGDRVWEQEIGGTHGPWVAGDYIYVLSNDVDLICLTRQDGRVRWASELPHYENMKRRKYPVRWAGPVLAGDRLIVVASTGEAISLSPYTGQALGRTEFPDSIFLDPIVADDTLYVLTDEADLIALK